MKQQIKDKYDFLEIIGKGNFGTIYKVMDKNNKQLFACKVEKNTSSEVLVQRENFILKKLHDTNLFPKSYYYEKNNEQSYLVMDLLGMDLQKKKVKIGNFGMRTVALIAKQLFNNLQALHNHGFLHRDIKPENILIGEQHQVYLIDFGLVKRISNTPPPKCRSIIGSVRYASREAHFGNSSKIGDFESLSYVLLYLFTGFLPWQSLSVQQIQTQLKRINSYQQQPVMTTLLKMKYQINDSMFPDYKFRQKAFMQQLMCLIKHIQKHEKQQTPNYKKLSQFIDRLLFISDGFNNKCFDWCSNFCTDKNKESIDQLWNIAKI